MQAQLGQGNYLVPVEHGRALHEVAEAGPAAEAEPPGETVLPAQRRKNRVPAVALALLVNGLVKLDPRNSDAPPAT
ncbi:MAG: hypothetical protein BRD47_04995 [Bacteroidetes bacterium QS_8_68_28]|nr:MAG: hypothetical protein BRD47_04995 [Bacteroidetes bacterium QS_8_68_28]